MNDLSKMGLGNIEHLGCLVDGTKSRHLDEVFQMFQIDIIAHVLPSLIFLSLFPRIAAEKSF